MVPDLLDTTPEVPDLLDITTVVPDLLDITMVVPDLLDITTVVPDLLDIFPVVQVLVIKATRTHNLPQVHLEIVRPLKSYLIYSKGIIFINIEDNKDIVLRKLLLAYSSIRLFKHL